MLGMLGMLGSAAGIGYNIYQNWRSRQDYLKQQNFSNNMAQNAMQIRTTDLQKAGLHPTLAAGGQGAVSPPVGSAAQQPVHGNVMENAMLSATLKQNGTQTANTEAQTDQVRNSIEIDNEKLEILKQELGIKQSAESREVDVHGWRKALQSVEYNLKAAHVDDTKASAAIKWLEHKFMDKHHMKMPIQQAWIQQLTNALVAIFGVSKLGAGTIVRQVSNAYKEYIAPQTVPYSTTPPSGADHSKPVKKGLFGRQDVFTSDGKRIYLPKGSKK